MGDALRKVARHFYDKSGSLNKLQVGNTTALLKDFASNVNYNEAGQLTSMVLGAGGANPTSEKYDYDPQTGLLTEQRVIRGTNPLINTPSPLMHLSYSYWKPGASSGPQTGQLTSIIDHKNAERNRSYKYDPLGRLIEATGGSAQPWTQKYTYDQWGNRQTVSVSGNMPETSPQMIDPSEEEETGSTVTPPEEPPAPTAGGGQTEAPTAQTPPSGDYFDVPATIQAEDFGDNAAGGASYSEGTEPNMGGASYRPETSVDIQSDGNGGYYVGYTQTGEWLEYPLNIAVSDTYTIEAQVADMIGQGSFRIEIREVGNTDPSQTYNTGALTVPATGGENSYQTVSKEGVSLRAGHYVMRVVMESESASGVVANFDSFKIIPSAASTHRTPFDFDGDGKTDVATYRSAMSSTDSNWAILNSSTANAKGERNLGSSVQYQAEPEDKDRGVPGDYDGHGKTDTAVWTPGTGNWLIKPSSGNPGQRV